MVEYKARFVADGSSQIVSRDFTSLFAPTVRLVSVHVFLALCAQLALSPYHSSGLRFEMPLSFRRYTCVRSPSSPMGQHLHPVKFSDNLKSLYGLRQSPRNCACLPKFFCRPGCLLRFDAWGCIDALLVV